MKKIIALLSALVLILGLCACTATEPEAPATDTSQGPTWQEQYDLGVRYLSEGNYEEAILAFTAAIEIDPKRAPAYVGRGDAYVGSGETEANLAAALADYEKAFELEPRPETEEKIQRIRGVSTGIVAENGWYKISDFFEGTAISTQPTIGGINVTQKTFLDVAEFYGAHFKGEGTEWEDKNIAIANNVWISQGQTYFSIGYGHSAEYEPEYLAVHFGDSFDLILQKLGLTEAGAQCLREMGDRPLTIDIIHSANGVRPYHKETSKETSQGSTITITSQFSEWWDVMMLFDEDDLLVHFNVSVHRSALS